MKFRPKFFHIIILTFAFLVSCSKKELPDDNAARNESDTIIRLTPYDIAGDSLNEEYLKQKHASVERFAKKTWRNYDNLSFLVAKDGEIIYEQYQGFADKNTGTTITSMTPLHLASVSKVITATAILQLIDAGKITLDQKVNTLFPEFPYPDVTVKTLLNHRSGLKNYAYYADEKDVWNRRVVMKNSDILELFARNKPPLDFRTDKKFAYCNTNYAILASIVEKVTGMSFAQALRTMIFEPLGMTNTFVFEYEKDKNRIVPSYKGNNMEIGLDHLDGIYGDKNIYSTPRDMLKFDSARYHPEYLTPELMKKVYVGYSYEHKGEKNYGLGIRIIEWVTGQHFYFHNGWWHGNTSAYVNLKDERVMIIALSNKFTPKTYKVRFLAKLFGDYPFKMGKDDVFE